MSLFVTAIFLFFAFVTLAIAGGFATDAARRITTIPGYEANPDLVSAHRWLTIAAIVTWITVAMIIVLAIVYVIFAAETLGAFANLATYTLLILSLGATIAVGILAAIAANDIEKSGISDNKLSRRNSIIAAVLAIVVFVFLLIGLIIRFTYKPKSQADKQTENQIQTLKDELNEPLTSNGGLLSENAPDYLHNEMLNDPQLASALR